MNQTIPSATKPFPCKSGLFLAFVFLMLSALSMNAATLGYWRFESGALLNDSGGNAAGPFTLLNVGGNNNNDNYVLPATGNGAFFPKTIPLTGASNLNAALFTLSESPSDMFNAGQNIALTAFNTSVEAFACMTSIPGNIFDRTIFARNSYFSFGVARASNGSVPVFKCRAINTAGSTIARTLLAPSAFAMSANNDYYLAACWGLIGGTTETLTRTLFVYWKNLTANGPLKLYVAPQLDIRTSIIFNSNYGYIGYDNFFSNQENWDGVLDEVRLSNTVLSQSELQITAPGSLPQVEITAPDTLASEGGDSASFRITRTGATTAALSVNLDFGGEAVNGIDYQTIPSTVVIPAGQSELLVPVTPIADGVTEGYERVLVVLQMSPDYVVGPALGSGVVIAPPTALTSLSLSSGTLSPTFTPSVTSYTASVTNDVSSITVTPMELDPTSSIQVRVNGGTFATVTSGSASGSLALNVGANPVDVMVTAQDSTTKTYTVTVTRVSNNADLSSLLLSAGTLSPTFASGTTGYAASVPNSTASMTVTPTKAEANATIQVRVNAGAYASVISGNASGGLTLNVGANPIDVKVTAQNGTTIKTYTVTVTRESAIQSWRQTWYGTTSSTGNAADLADPYNIGIPNLVVFGFFGPSQNPSQARIRLLPQPQLSGGNFFITFTQPAGVTGITYGAEWRPELTTGSWQTITDTGSGNVHTFSLPIAGNPKVFVRLKVTAP